VSRFTWRQIRRFNLTLILVGSWLVAYGVSLLSLKPYALSLKP
jgi:hypothetical protein